MTNSYETQAESYGLAACLSSYTFLTSCDSSQRCAGGEKRNEAASNHSTSNQDAVEVNHENAVDTIVSAEDGMVLTVSNICAVRPSLIKQVIQSSPKKRHKHKQSYASKLKTTVASYKISSSDINSVTSATASSSSTCRVPVDKESQPHNETMNGTFSLFDEQSVKKSNKKNKKPFDEERTTVEVYYRAKAKRFPYLGLKGRRYVVETQNDNYLPEDKKTQQTLSS